ncbi:hypothetical protein CLV24_11693 [Pontibacter ummariensis]|uniref:EF hand n=1 Tax=Pontibacter ummariensis TaxID=1610492 RepID=A0A239I6Q0_9BACT|nr:hypothetical protein [Pontibacter ummariensis]PRY10025.1 hypothetical protein CLV24_11693 [Pontibacter ummariensis]SNS89062.1 hypothetical protein SAMN06296052_1166 [Pontibacter ummariensis]
MKTNEIKIIKLLKTSAFFMLTLGFVACGQEGYEEGGDELGEVEAQTEDLGVVGAEAGVADGYDTERFNATFANETNYEGWDANQNSVLEENEFYGGFYDTWDTNNDERVDEEEWNTGTRDYRVANQNYGEWDANGDGVLDENEFGAGFANNNYFHDWDTDQDNAVNEREFTDGVFGLWDDNDDGILDSNEYTPNSEARQ